MNQLALLFIATLIATGHPYLAVSKEVISTQDDKNVPADLNRASNSNKTYANLLPADPLIMLVIDQMTKASQTEKLCELIHSLGHICQADTDKSLRKKCTDTVKYAISKAVKVQADCISIDNFLGSVSEEIQSDNSDEEENKELVSLCDGGLSGTCQARRRIILFSVFLCLGIITGLAVIFIASVMAACKKRSQRAQKSSNDAKLRVNEGTGESTKKQGNVKIQANPGLSTLAIGTYHPSRNESAKYSTT